MNRFRVASFWLGLSGGFTLAPAAYALDDNGAKAVIAKFIGAQKIDQAQASPGHHVIGDLNGDGKDDIVLQWDVLGATWSYPKLSIFLDQGKTYRTITTDLTGQIQKVSVNGSTILIDTLMPGPKDPRCCPTMKKRVTYQWANNKLVMLK
jgi:hypothetical protein